MIDLMAVLIILVIVRRFYIPRAEDYVVGDEVVPFLRVDAVEELRQFLRQGVKLSCQRHDSVQQMDASGRIHNRCQLRRQSRHQNPEFIIIYIPFTYKSLTQNEQHPFIPSFTNFEFRTLSKLKKKLTST